MKKILTYIICGALAGALWADSELEKASVTMPYAELASLLERVSEVERSLAEEPAKPPINVIVDSAKYLLDCLPAGRPQLMAEFSVTNLSEEWQTIPLLSDDFVVLHVEPENAKLLTKGGYLCALFEPDTSLSLRIHANMNVLGTQEGVRTLVDFEAIPATRSVLTVQHPYEPGSLLVNGSELSGRYDESIGLPSSGGRVVVQHYQPQALLPTRWRGDSVSLVRSELGQLLLESRIRLSATDNGRTTQAVLQMPPAVDLRSLESADLAQPYRIEMSESGLKVIAEWKDDAALHRELVVVYAIPMLDVESALEVPRVLVDSVVGWNSTYYVMPFDGFSIVPKGAAWLEANRPPSWVATTSGARELYRYLDTNREGLQIVAKALPRLKTADATISQATYYTDLVVEGGVLHRAEVAVDHVASTRYEFTLPGSSKLLTCDVEGRSVEPLLSAEGVLSVVLPQNTQGKTRIHYVFTAKGAAMEPVEGAAMLELPRTPLFINEVKWLVQLPKVYQATAIEGNVGIDGSGESGGLVRLSKQICDDESPHVRLYYTRKDLNQ